MIFLNKIINQIYIDFKINFLKKLIYKNKSI